MRKKPLSALALTVVLACTTLLLASCASHPPLAGGQTALAMRPASSPDLGDDLDLPGLADAIDRDASTLERAAAQSPSEALRFGPIACTKTAYARALRHFSQLARATPERERFFDAVRDEFDFYEVYGDKTWGRVFMTSYYEAVVQGSLTRTARFSRPLYGVPTDLVALDLKAFDADKFGQERKLRGRVEGGKFVPYFTRSEIDAKGALAGRKLELVWVDPVDAHDIHVQGSGVIALPDGKTLRVGYADRNGWPYDTVGKYVRDNIPKEKLSLQAVDDYLHGLSPDRMQQVLDRDQSYIFFHLTGSAETSMGLTATPGRTIATDPRFFPKGGLAFLVSTKPKWDAADPKAYVPTGFEPFSRFVLDQDIGGAITGGGRLDLFWGSGDEAKRNAGVIKQEGRLYYLVPKAGCDAGALK